MTARARPLHQCGAAVLAIVVHLGIGLALAACLFAAPRDNAIETVVGWDAGESTEVALLPQLSGEQTRDRVGGAAKDLPLDPTPSPTLPDPSFLLPGDEVASTQTAIEPGQGVGTAGTGEGRGVGEGDGGSMRFFETGSESKRIVYVVDASGSMTQLHPGPLKTRIARVKQELIRSVLALHGEQQYFIIFFNDHAHPMPGRQLVAGGDNDESMRFLQWAAATRPGGGTEPEQALKMAIALRPDTIFFLTDGSFRKDTMRAVLASNKQRVPIHTICIGDRRGEPQLIEMADHSGGSYVYEAGGEMQTVSRPRPADPLSGLLRALKK